MINPFRGSSRGGSASFVTFVPAGDIASTDVQAALEELDIEKAAVAGGAGEWGLPIAVTLTDTGEAILSGPGWYTIDSYGGAASDNLIKISGLSKGDQAILAPANSAHTIIVIDGTNLVLNRDITFTMDNEDDCFIVQCIDASNDICRELGSKISGGA